MAKDGDLENKVRAAIMSGELVPASRLRMEDLKSRFDVGFSPIREALSRLVAEGLVELERNKGFRVRPLSRADLLDIGIARCAVEKEALRRSILNGGDDWEADIVAAMHNYRKKSAKAFDGAEGLTEWEAAHDRLHAVLIGACGSQRLLEMQARLQDQHLRYRRLIVVPQVSSDLHEEEHERLVATVLARDVETAIDMIERHMMITIDALETAGFWDQQTEKIN